MPESPSTPIPSPHDKFFHEVFSRPEVARQFFQSYLPPAIVQHCEWNTLQLQPCRFVDAQLTDQQTDLLHTVQCASWPLCLYLLFEHKSAPDAWTRLQLLQYIVRIWTQWLKEHPSRAQGARLPPILALVVHQGPQPWLLSTQFLDLVELPAEVRVALESYQPKFAHGLVDLATVPMEQLGGALVVDVVLSLAKAVRADRLAE
jgi:predicted transposase YdaD